MNEHKELVLRALGNMTGDNTAREKHAFRNKTKDQMDEQYGLSGKTCAEILSEYEEQDSKVLAAIGWVNSLDA